MSPQQLQEHIDSTMRKCPGKIYGQMHQLFARTKHGDFDYTKSNIMSKNLGSIVLTENDFEYYEQKKEKSQDSR